MFSCLCKYPLRSIEAVTKTWKNVFSTYVQNYWIIFIKHFTFSKTTSFRPAIILKEKCILSIKVQSKNAEQQCWRAEQLLWWNTFQWLFLYIVTTSKFWSWIVTCRKISKMALSTGSQKKQELSPTCPLQNWWSTRSRQNAHEKFDF